jgi:dTDP-glucose 4,6-dehydratase
MRILITGSEGVLGSVLKAELRKRGHEVFGCDLQHSDDSQVMRADISEHRQLARVFKWCEPDLVYHFAAEFGRVNSETYWEQVWKTNCVGTRNVIEECLKPIRGIKPMLVFASSSEAYGAAELYSEGARLTERMTDDFVPQFHNEYSLSKYVNERQIHTAVRNHGLRAVILRFFNVYGPPEIFTPFRSVVCQFIYQMLHNLPVVVNTGGYRSHLWIGDWCNTVACIPDRLSTLTNKSWWPGSKGALCTPVFNIGSEDMESIVTLYNRLADIIKPCSSSIYFLESEFANTPARCPNTELAREWLDHNPKMNFQDGLEITVAAMRKQYGF